MLIKSLNDIELIGTTSMSEERAKIQDDLNKLEKLSEINQDKGKIFCYFVIEF